MGLPQKKSVALGKVPFGGGHDSDPETLSDRIASKDEEVVLSGLKDLVAAGDLRLDSMLLAIADAALRLTGASGSALAMWKDGAMVCRARSGVTAPALGAQLNAETGISGECLRTGKVQHCSDTENNSLVDAEVCRSLGLRSIAVLPIQGWRGVNGILEAFATTPAAFTEHHLEVLEQLAALAERARASQPYGASPVAVKSPAEKAETSGLLPASDPVGEVALAFVGRRSRPVVLGLIGLSAALLIGFVIWLGWRGPDESKRNAHAAAPSSAATVTAAALPVSHIPDSDPVWKANPGGEKLFSSFGKSSAGTPIRLASKVDVIKGKSGKDASLLSADAAGVALPQRAPESDVSVTNNSSEARQVQDTASAEPPTISEYQSNSAALDGVLSAKATLPRFAAPVSQGVTGGRLLRRVAPVYPAQAKLQRLEGKVLLNATVMEDGTVRDPKVVQGNPTLAQSALEAVKQWRYQPFVLDGKPVKTDTAITVEFKLPSGNR